MSHAGKTVLITGASSGIGLETALHFFEQGWNVLATMRHPEKRRTALHDKGLPDLLHLDVMEPASIRAAIDYGIERYQAIDVLVNNAGYALYGPFEAATEAQVARQFDTNVFGLLAVTREFLPLFRRQKGGVLINVASMGGRIGFPFWTLYNSTKWAVEGFSESLQYELKPLNIRVRVIEPGVIHTDFYDRSLDVVDATALAEDYRCFEKPESARTGEATRHKGTEPCAVARTIYRAATDSGWRLRYPVGNDARLVSALRWLLPERAFCWCLTTAYRP